MNLCKCETFIHSIVISCLYSFCNVILYVMYFDVVIFVLVKLKIIHKCILIFLLFTVSHVITLIFKIMLNSICDIQIYMCTRIDCYNWRHCKIILWTLVFIFRSVYEWNNVFQILQHKSLFILSKGLVCLCIDVLCAVCQITIQKNSS